MALWMGIALMTLSFWTLITLGLQVFIIGIVAGIFIMVFSAVYISKEN